MVLKLNTMKKLMMAFALAAGAYGVVNAQTPSSTVNANPGGIYLKGGVNFSNISVNSDGAVNEANALTTFNVGFIGDIPIADIFSFQTGLYLNGKGSKTESYFGPNRDANYYKVRFNPLYLELPANFVLKIPVDNRARFYAGAGPYIAMGIGGKVKGTQNIAGNESTYERTIKFNNDDPTTSEQEDASVSKLRRFDGGVNFLAGVEVDRFMIGVNYGLGLSKIGSTQDNNNDKNKYRIWSVNVGVRL